MSGVVTRRGRDAARTSRDRRRDPRIHAARRAGADLRCRVRARLPRGLVGAVSELLYTDAHVVGMIELHLDAGPTDHMLGCQVRNLFELRAAELRGYGVVGLPDDGSPYDPRD